MISNALAYARFDKFPVNPGHQLVLPRRHVASYFESTAAERAALFHVHLIPRYAGDVPDPRGGVRGVIPDKQKY